MGSNTHSLRGLTCIAPMFSISWSVLDAPKRTELTPSFRRHHAAGDQQTAMTTAADTLTPQPFQPLAHLYSDGSFCTTSCQTLQLPSNSWSLKRDLQTEPAKQSLKTVKNEFWAADIFTFQSGLVYKRLTTEAHFLTKLRFVVLIICKMIN